MPSECGRWFSPIVLASVSVISQASCDARPRHGRILCHRCAVYNLVIYPYNGGTSILQGADDSAAALTLPFSLNSRYRLQHRAQATECAPILSPPPPPAPGSVDFANGDLSVGATPNDFPALLRFGAILLPFKSKGRIRSIIKRSSRREPPVCGAVESRFPVTSTSQVTFEVDPVGGHQPDFLFQYERSRWEARRIHPATRRLLGYHRHS